MTKINLLGLVLNIAGTILVSVSAGRVFTCMHTALMAHQVTLMALFSRSQGVPLFTGLDDSREKEIVRGNRLLYFGLFLVGVGFVLQGVAAAAPLFAGSTQQ